MLYFTGISKFPGFLGISTHVKTMCTRPSFSVRKGLGTRLHVDLPYFTMSEPGEVKRSSSLD